MDNRSASNRNPSIANASLHNTRSGNGNGNSSKNTGIGINLPYYFLASPSKDGLRGLVFQADGNTPVKNAVVNPTPNTSGNSSNTSRNSFNTSGNSYNTSRNSSTKTSEEEEDLDMALNKILMKLNVSDSRSSESSGPSSVKRSASNVNRSALDRLGSASNVSTSALDAQRSALNVNRSALIANRSAAKVSVVLNTNKSFSNINSSGTESGCGYKRDLTLDDVIKLTHGSGRPSSSAGRLVNHITTSEQKVETAMKKPFAIPKSEVVMPTGKNVEITLPSKPRCTCDTLSETLYIPLKSSNEEYKIISDEMNSTVRKHVSGSFNACDIQSIKKIKNCCLWMRYKNRQRDIAKENIQDINERMLFHGSMACEQICKSGFDERHANQGGMFGAGIYFAKHSSKSNQYVFGYMGGNGCPKHANSNCTTCPRKMLLCRVTLGNMKKLTSASKMAHAPPGFHSVYGVPSTGGLLYDEFIIYRGEQAYPEYEILYTIK